MIPSAVKLTLVDGAVRLAIHAKPRAKKSKVVGVHGDALSVAIAAPPVDGAANDEVVRFLATLFDVAPQDVALVRGGAARMKLVAIGGTTVEAVRKAIADAL